MKMHLVASPLEVASNMENTFRELHVKLAVFLSQHPLAVGIRNQVSVALGEGGTLWLVEPSKAIDEAIEDFIDSL